MRVLAGLALALSVDCGVAVGERYEDPARGFSIDVPDGWQSLSSQELTMMTQNLRALGEKSEYVAGFKAKPGQLQTPYMIVQWLPNQLYGIHGQMTEAEIQEVADSFEQGLAANIARNMLQRQGVNASTNQPESDFNFDMARKQILYTMEVDVQGTHICFLGRMQFGREGVFQPLYYVNTIEELGAGSLARQTVMSLQVAPSAAWSEAAPAGTRESVSERKTKRVVNGAVRGAIIGGVIGGLIGGIWWLFKKLGGT